MHQYELTDPVEQLLQNRCHQFRALSPLLYQTIFAYELN